MSAEKEGPVSRMDLLFGSAMLTPYVIYETEALPDDLKVEEWAGRPLTPEEESARRAHDEMIARANEDLQAAIIAAEQAEEERLRPHVQATRLTVGQLIVLLQRFDPALLVRMDPGGMYDNEGPYDDGHVRTACVMGPITLLIPEPVLLISSEPEVEA